MAELTTSILMDVMESNLNLSSDYKYEKNNAKYELIKSWAKSWASSLYKNCSGDEVAVCYSISTFTAFTAFQPQFGKVSQLMKLCIPSEQKGKGIRKKALQ